VKSLRISADTNTNPRWPHLTLAVRYRILSRGRLSLYCGYRAVLGATAERGRRFQVGARRSLLVTGRGAGAAGSGRRQV